MTKRVSIRAVLDCMSSLATFTQSATERVTGRTRIRISVSDRKKDWQKSTSQGWSRLCDRLAWLWRIIKSRSLYGLRTPRP